MPRCSKHDVSMVPNVSNGWWECPCQPCNHVQAMFDEERIALAPDVPMNPPTMFEMDGNYYSETAVAAALRAYVEHAQAVRDEGFAVPPIHGACGRRMRAGMLGQGQGRWLCGHCRFSVSMNADEIRAFERKTVLRPVPAEKSCLRPLLETVLDQINAYAFGPNEKVGPALSSLAGEIDRVDKLLENQK